MRMDLDLPWQNEALLGRHPFTLMRHTHPDGSGSTLAERGAPGAAAVHTVTGPSNPEYVWRGSEGVYVGGRAEGEREGGGKRGQRKGTVSGWVGVSGRDG